MIYNSKKILFQNKTKIHQYKPYNYETESFGQVCVIGNSE